MSQIREEEPESAAWLSLFPSLAEIDNPLWEEAIGRAYFFTLPPGKVVFRPGDKCERFIFVLQGNVRVCNASETGRQIVLYRVRRGESCVLSLSSWLGKADYAAEAVTETEVKVACIPIHYFNRLMAGCDDFRSYVFATLGRRLWEVMLLLEEVSFQRLDTRLARHLMEHLSSETTSVAITHHDLAAELGSTREVVSRTLKEFERCGWIRLQRRKIEVLAPTALTALITAEVTFPRHH